MVESGEARVHQVGGWRFDAVAGELSNGDVRRRLEDRAARTLELLCRAGGQVVSHQALVEAIWNGRTLSPNSTAVVIADLRRALGDDARNPRILETVPKRGYRLVAAPAATDRVDAVPPPHRRWLGLAAAGLGVVMLGGGLFAWRSSHPRLLLGVGAVVNETGRPAYEPLARSVSELTLTRLGRLSGIRLVRGRIDAGLAADPARRLNLQGRLAMWSGHPTVYLTAVDPRSGAVVWSGMALGPEDSLPANIDNALKDFEASL